ncbi:MAG: TrkH family potassium uptake protein [Treponema sp.]|nr:TrkH family potassium uptake protein [Treponema sp.]
MTVLTFLKIISIIIAFVGTSFLFPIGTAAALGETVVLPSFIIPMIASWIAAAIIFIAGRKHTIRLSTRGTFVIVAVAWVSVSLFGAAPLYFSGAIPHFADAVFESVSGISTTGATILNEVESLPRSINLWRCETHWLGGMGIVALTVALLPLLGVGGFQLIKAETTGPEKGKVTPKITTTAKILWATYAVLTVLQLILLMVAGMDFIDALSHAFATLGTGGFSTRNTSVGAYNSATIDIICTVFMVIAGVNFSLYYYAVIRKFSEIRENTELKVYIGIFFVAALLLALLTMQQYGSFFRAFRYSSFQSAAILTTTGFATADFTTWVPVAQLIIFLLYFIGGCAGSTGGGIKVIRWIVLTKQVHNETKKLLHPHGIFNIRLNGKVASKGLVLNIAAFISLYFLLVMITAAIGCLFNLDIFSSLTGALSMVGNVGPAFNKLGPSCNYGFLPDTVKWWYSFAMLAGRLELYTMIIYFLPAYWKK